ncbi:hypothetical protein [Delftia tsuruhatensis]|uniref:hypothetical protein n=1 Tax=Delftia tsuruhatensis TaxID=180282 RepID=UPI0028A7F100|nr:hypothetical protein [Delftia tsuruhatensis]
MAQVSKVLVSDQYMPPDNIQQYKSTTGFPLVYASRHINPHALVFDNTGRPANYNPANNRHTIVMDVRFSDGYLAACHMGIIARHKGSYSVAGDNRGGAVIAGNWGYSPGSVALEEIEITNTKDNGDSHHRPSAQYPRGAIGEAKLEELRWYRLVIESISKNGSIGHAVRATDKSTGQTVFSLPTFWSDYSANYDSRDAGKVVLFSISDPNKPAAGFVYTRLISYWSDADEVIANP